MEHNNKQEATIYQKNKHMEHNNKQETKTNIYIYIKKQTWKIMINKKRINIYNKNNEK